MRDTCNVGEAKGVVIIIIIIKTFRNNWVYKLTWYWNTSSKWISSITRNARADGTVVYYITSSV